MSEARLRRAICRPRWRLGARLGPLHRRSDQVLTGSAVLRADGLRGQSRIAASDSARRSSRWAASAARARRSRRPPDPTSCPPTSAHDLRRLRGLRRARCCHFAGRVRYYESWVEPNHSSMWAGSVPAQFTPRCSRPSTARSDLDATRAVAVRRRRRLRHHRRLAERRGGAALHRPGARRSARPSRPSTSSRCTPTASTPSLAPDDAGYTHYLVGPVWRKDTWTQQLQGPSAGVHSSRLRRAAGLAGPSSAGLGTASRGATTSPRLQAQATDVTQAYRAPESPSLSFVQAAFWLQPARLRAGGGQPGPGVLSATTACCSTTSPPSRRQRSSSSGFLAERRRRVDRPGRRLTGAIDAGGGSSMWPAPDLHSAGERSPRGLRARKPSCLLAGRHRSERFGAAVTAVALRGHWEHEGPCQLGRPTTRSPPAEGGPPPGCSVASPCADGADEQAVREPDRRRARRRDRLVVVTSTAARPAAASEHDLARAAPGHEGRPPVVTAALPGQLALGVSATTGITRSVFA